jgi:hypothetical protein
MQRYAWKHGKSFPIDATFAGAEIDRLVAANGGPLTPEQLLAAAEMPDSPLHPAFDWSEAAGVDETGRRRMAFALITGLQPL